eukprot:COSAG02_NODE_59805_length_273_cov_0.597701_1_plen_47_part_01
MMAGDDYTVQSLTGRALKSSESTSGTRTNRSLASSTLGIRLCSGGLV